jgi:hydroxyacylglutathione hydrolase
MKLTERIHLVGGSGYGLSPIGDCNVYLVNGGKELALIDTGGGAGVQSILNNIVNDGLEPKRIKKALITHAHYDHIGGNHEMVERTGCKILCHPLEKEAIETLNECSLYDMAVNNGLRFEACKVDKTIDEGDQIQVGDLLLNVVHTPGHTPGCISFTFTEEDTKKGLLCGDIAGAQGRLGFINGPGFSLEDWKNSIKKLIKLKPDRLYPGHNTFLMSNATDHLKMYDAKMNAPWTTIVTSVG